MALASGTRLGPYEIASQIGVGGMGEVYRATDTNLARQVAIKVLPEAVAFDTERLARFDREAKTLAALNHPNIAAIYGMEKSDGVTALVMELVEGPTLADRIAQGAIPVYEALPIAKQIAEALEAAHEQGIVHRDLKPANVKVRTDGTVKVLDFGLAKAMEPIGRLSPTVSQSPTITTPTVTQAGIILGTAAYMSPEQARGRAVDKRTDIWAFGCVFYEMLTGKRAFDGEDVSETLAAVLRAEPNTSLLPVNVSVGISVLIAGALTKDPRRRLGDMSTILFLLHHDTGMSTADTAPPSAAQTRHWLAVSLALVLVASLGVIGGRLTSPSAPAPLVTRFAAMLPEDQRFTENGSRIIDVSPDGTHLVYVANKRLYVRSISDFEAQPIAGTEISEGLITGPMFSPDGQSIAYWIGSGESGGGTLKKISLSGGPAMTLSRLGFPAGLSWSTAGIIAGLRDNTIVRIPSNGGPPELLATVTDGNVWGPQMLPGGDALLFTLTKVGAGFSVDDLNEARIVVQSLTSDERKTVLEGGSDARYIPTGHVIYFVGTTLFAVPFDLSRREAIGRGVPLVEDVSRRPFGGVGAYAAISETGTLVYASGAAPPLSVELIERTGRMTSLNVPPAVNLYPRISRDGTRLALERDDNNASDIWVADLTGASSIRQLTLTGRRNKYPIWSPDGQRVAFQSDRDGDAGIFWQHADGSGMAERLTKADHGTTHVPQSWSPDGKTLLFTMTLLDGSFTLNMLSRASGTITSFGDVRSIRYTPGATFSPDGRWVAYTVSEGDANPVSGARVLVQPFPPTGASYAISRGLHPMWSPDGKELFYHRLPDTRDHMEVVTVTSQPTQRNFTFSNPMSLPMRDMQFSRPDVERNWDIMPDGKRLVGLSSVVGARGQINVVLNWSEELKRLVPTK